MGNNVFDDDATQRIAETVRRVESMSQLPALRRQRDDPLDGDEANTMLPFQTYKISKSVLGIRGGHWNRSTFRSNELDAPAGDDPNISDKFLASALEAAGMDIGLWYVLIVLLRTDDDRHWELKPEKLVYVFTKDFKKRRLP